MLKKNRFSNYQKIVNLGFPYSLGFYSIRKTTKIFKESDIVFSKSISDMPRFNRYDIDWKPEKNDKTGPNIIVKALPRLSFYDKTSGKLISNKSVPRDLRGFAKLNKPSQAHLISTFFKYSLNIRWTLSGWILFQKKAYWIHMRQNRALQPISK